MEYKAGDYIAVIQKSLKTYKCEGYVTDVRPSTYNPGCIVTVHLQYPTKGEWIDIELMDIKIKKVIDTSKNLLSPNKKMLLGIMLEKKVEDMKASGINDDFNILVSKRDVVRIIRELTT